MSCAGCDPCSAGGCDCSCAGACGVEASLAPPSNRAGRAALQTRIGAYGDFFADALRRLSARDAPALRALGTRERADPAIALLDAWSVAADVLTFYRERLTEEGYLRTAHSERSLRELAAGVGFRPRPGVAATVHLAFLLDPNAAPVDIPARAKAQTIPQPGEQMQTFETDEALQARAEWSVMAPRLDRVPAIDRVSALTRATVRLNDAALLVRPGERLLFRFGDVPAQQIVREVASARNDVQNGCVVLTLKPRPGLTAKLAAAVLDVTDALVKQVRDGSKKPPPKSVELANALVSYLLGASIIDALGGSGSGKPTSKNLAGIDDVLDIFTKNLGAPADPRTDVQAADIDDSFAALQTAPPAPLRSARYLPRVASDGLTTGGATRGALLQALTPGLAPHLYAAWRNLPATASSAANAPQLYLMRAVASPYGAAAALRTSLVSGGQAGDWNLQAVDKDSAFLDAVNDAISPDSWALVQTPSVSDATNHTIRFARVAGAGASQRGDYNLNGKVTRLDLLDPETGELLKVPYDPTDKLSNVIGQLTYLRNTVFTVQSEGVALAPEPIADDIAGDSIMLGGLYDNLAAGRWVIVAGERTDVVVGGVPVPGIQDGELAMIASVDQAPDPGAPADARRTVITLQASLAFRYRRASLAIYGNVAPASHGETVADVLGSGDAQARFAAFDLKRAPLTFVAAPSVSGVQGTQAVRVNDVLWQEADSLLDAGPAARVYELATDGDGAATVVFGDGVHGARLPTGQDNVRAQFRVGIGSAGNVQPGQITMLSTRPLGVQGVVNPLRASGGAERDGIEQIRRNLPQAVLALAPRSRLVSVADHAWFAQRFAGIGHAQAVRLAAGGASVVYLTLAGVDDMPLAPDGALLASLAAAFQAYGDPALAVVLGVRELIALVLQANVAILADADWNVVEPALRARLLDAFSFARAVPGRPVYLSAAIAAMQATPGVDWVDVDVFGGISELQLRDKTALALAVTELERQAAGGAVPAQVACAPAMAAEDADAARAARIAQRDGVAARFLPAQLAMLVASVPGTLVFNLVQPRSPSC